MCKDYDKSKISPTTNLCMNYGLHMKAMSAIENMKQTNRQNRMSITFCHLAEISVVRNQFNFNMIQLRNL